jgi:hypothetical protein
MTMTIPVDENFNRHFTLHYGGPPEPNQENQEPFARQEPNQNQEPTQENKGPSIPLQWNARKIPKPELTVKYRADSLQESLEWLEDALLSPTHAQLNDPLVKLEQATDIGYGYGKPSTPVQRVVDFEALASFGADFQERLSM